MNNHKRPLRIAINAQLRSGHTGGVETAVTETIHALGRLSETTGDDDEYVIVGPGEDFDWLKPFLAGKQRLVGGGSIGQSAADPLEAAGGSALFDSLECDVVHFPYPTFTQCRMPTVYSPHDLQHLHFPQFFDDAHIRYREGAYRAACRESKTVIVATSWVAQDLIAKYQLPSEKVQVITWAPPIYGDSEVSVGALTSVEEKYNLHTPFALYPAATWEHKNHLRLLEAVRHLRSQGETPIDLICTGLQTPHYLRIDNQCRRLGLENGVRFLGRIPTEDLRALYRLARFVFVPTLFEAASAPLFEAWRERVPVACANVTSLAQQADDAALLFDSSSTEGIARAFHRMQTDDKLREVLLTNGQRRLKAFSWEKTAKAYRATYRRAAGRILSEEEQFLLSSMNGIHANGNGVGIEPDATENT